MKGWRTILVNVGAAAGLAVAQYVVGADLSGINPTVATVVLAVANIALRLITTTPVGKK